VERRDSGRRIVGEGSVEGEKQKDPGRKGVKEYGSAFVKQTQENQCALHTGEAKN